MQQVDVVVTTSPPCCVLVVVQQLLHPLLYPDLQVPAEDVILGLYSGQELHELLVEFLVQGCCGGLLHCSGLVLKYIILIDFSIIITRMQQQREGHIFEAVALANEACQIQWHTFELDAFAHPRWYGVVMAKLLPQMSDRLDYLLEMQNQQQAFKQLGAIIDSLQQFQPLNVDYSAVVQGKSQEILNLVYIILQLIDCVIENCEDGEGLHAKLGANSRLGPQLKGQQNQFKAEDLGPNTQQNRSLDGKKREQLWARQKTSREKRKKGSKSIRKLVKHPKELSRSKAKSLQSTQFTERVKKQIKKAQAKVKKPIFDDGIETSVLDEQVNRKNVELEYFVKDMKHHHNTKKTKNSLRKSSGGQEVRTEKLNQWRWQKIKTDRENYQKSLAIRLENQKQAYLKQINKLVFKLEKQKSIEAKKLYKQQLAGKNQMAADRLASLQKQYQDRVALLKEQNDQKSRQRKVKIDRQKEVEQIIRKQIVKQSQQQIIQMQYNYRSRRAHIQSDYRQLKQKIIRSYKSK